MHTSHPLSALMFDQLVLVSLLHYQLQHVYQCWSICAQCDAAYCGRLLVSTSVNNLSVANHLLACGESVIHTKSRLDSVWNIGLHWSDRAASSASEAALYVDAAVFVVVATFVPCNNGTITSVTMRLMTSCHVRPAQQV